MSKITMSGLLAARYVVKSTRPFLKSAKWQDSKQWMPIVASIRSTISTVSSLALKRATIVALRGGADMTVSGLGGFEESLRRDINGEGPCSAIGDQCSNCDPCRLRNPNPNSTTNKLSSSLPSLLENTS